MTEYLYSRDHQWVREEAGGVRVGLSEFAQEQLGEIAFVELPETGRRVAQGEAVCAVDSLKSTSEIYAPVSGVIVEVNRALAEEGGGALINSEPLGAGWLFSMQMNDPAELQQLLSAEEYRRYLETG
jgi:glycine cleavage system H protein